MKLYVASSWRNPHYEAALAHLRDAGFECYDFKNPSPCDHGFHWSEIEECWTEWTTSQFREGLTDHIAECGFRKDMTALRAADAVVLVLPCGRSAHLEAGWACGSCKTVVAYVPPGVKIEPELMYKMFAWITDDPTELVEVLRELLEADRVSRSLAGISAEG